MDSRCIRLGISRLVFYSVVPSLICNVALGKPLHLNFFIYDRENKSLSCKVICDRQMKSTIYSKCYTLVLSSRNMICKAMVHTSTFSQNLLSLDWLQCLLLSTAEYLQMVSNLWSASGSFGMKDTISMWHSILLLLSSAFNIKQLYRLFHFDGSKGGYCKKMYWELYKQEQYEFTIVWQW